MITTEEALLRKMVATKPKAKEPREDFLARLLDGVEKLEDKDWEKMGQEPGGTAAQQWCNDAVDARKGEKELPDFVAAADEEADAEDDAEGEADDVAEDEAEDEAGAADDDEEDKPVKKAKAKVVAKTKVKAKAAKVAKAEPEEKEAPAKSLRAKSAKLPSNGPIDGIKVRIKDLVIDEPNIPLEDLLAKLSKGGDKMSRMTVSSVRSETRHTLRVLKQKGKLKGVEI